MPSSVVFLDASVILSGLASPSGGSRALLDAGVGRKLSLVATETVIEEVNANLQKLHVSHGDLDRLLDNKTIRIVPTPQRRLVARFAHATRDPDDAHVLAGTVLSGATVLVSLDRKHVVTTSVRRLLFPIQVFTPKQF